MPNDINKNGDKIFYDPWTFGFNFDFTSVLRSFKSMASKMINKMMGGEEDTPNPKARKFVDFVQKKSTPPPDVMSADFQPFICRYSPNQPTFIGGVELNGFTRSVIYKCSETTRDGLHKNYDNDLKTCPRIADTEAMRKAYLCDETKDCVHYFDWSKKTVDRKWRLCASQSEGKKCKSKLMLVWLVVWWLVFCL